MALVLHSSLYLQMVSVFLALNKVSRKHFVFSVQACQILIFRLECYGCDWVSGSLCPSLDSCVCLHMTRLPGHTGDERSMSLPMLGDGVAPGAFYPLF